MSLPTRPRRRLVVTEGQPFGRATVIREVRLTGRDGRTRRGARLRCGCGTEFETMLVNLFSTERKTWSCGCLHSEVAAANARRMHELNRTHGLSKHPLYSTWRGILARCEDPEHHAYPDYGGRGIKVCADWRDVAVFIRDVERELGPRPPGMTLNRKDNDGRYERGNVQWADVQQQNANRRRLRVDQLAAELSLARQVLAEHGLLEEFQRRMSP